MLRRLDNFRSLAAFLLRHELLDRRENHAAVRDIEQLAQVTEMLGGGADGGVDLVLNGNGNRVVVQCKRWKNRSVPVQIVRKLYGVMHDQAAAAGKLVTTSSFTSEAAAFANGKAIELVGADELLRLIRSVQTSGKMNWIGGAEQDTQSDHLTPDCPRCRSVMVMRTAKRGSNAGSRFWGCSKYPECRGTREI